MNGSAMNASAECRTILADGTMATVTATRRLRSGRADVKCSVPGAAALAERMQQVVRMARHTEARVDSRDQVVLSLDRAPGPHERDWELAAVLADRMVRGLWQGAAPVANGWSGEWHLGRLAGHDLANPPAMPGLVLGGPGHLPYLGALTGQPDAAAAVSSARAWFPLHSGGVHDSLCWVEVSVYPLAAGDGEDDAIAVPGADLTLALAVREALTGARQFDPRGTGRWRTVVRFEQPRFQGNSFELALVLADRMARGREFLARGRILASGCSSGWHAGRVDSVDGMAPKCALLLAQAVAGDRILLPKAWEPALDPDFLEAAKTRAVRVVCIERIGIL